MVASVSRDGKKCDFRWMRERLRTKWVRDPDRFGYMTPDHSLIGTKFRCPLKKLLNLDGYLPGDYKQFYEDPRTRADYLKWAPLLLAAEDYYAKGRK